MYFLIDEGKKLAKYDAYGDERIDKWARLFNQVLIAQTDNNIFDSLRNYTINIIGYGDQGQRLSVELAEIVKEPDSKIEKVNIWLRKTDDAIKSEEDRFHHDFSYLKSKGNDEYDEIRETFMFRSFRQLSKLSEIKEQAMEDENRGDLTLVLTRYSSLSNIIDSERMEPLSVPEIAGRGISKEDLVKMIKTTFFDIDGLPVSEDPAEVLKDLEYVQQRRLKLEKIIDGEQERQGINQKRLDFLKDNILGVTELGKALNGYKGTILNLVNDVDVSTYALASAADMPVNRVWAPTGIDDTRVLVYLEEMMEEELGVKPNNIELPHTIGPHGDISLSMENVKVDGKEFREIAGKKSKQLFESAMKKAKSYGLRHAKTFKSTSQDTTFSSLIPVIISILTEENDRSHKGSQYLDDFDCYTGIPYTIQRGKSKTLQSRLDELYIPEFSENTKIIRGVTHRLVEENFFRRLDGEREIIEEVPRKETDKSGLKSRLEERLKKGIWHIRLDESEHGQPLIITPLHKEDKKKVFPLGRPEPIKDYLASTLYLLSKDMRRIFRKYGFNHAKAQLDFEARVINGKDIDEINYENRKMWIEDIQLFEDQIIALCGREHKFFPDEYRLLHFSKKNNKVAKLKNFESENDDFRLNNLLVQNGEIYYVSYENGISTIMNYDSKTQRSKPLMEWEGSIDKLAKHKEDFFGSESDIVYNFSQEEKLYSSEDSFIDSFSFLREQGILFFNFFGKELIALDIESLQTTDFENFHDTYGVYGREGIVQFVSDVEEGVLVRNYHDKKSVLRDRSDQYLLRDVVDEKMNSFFIQDENLFFLGTRKSNRLYAVGHTSNGSYSRLDTGITDFKQFGGLLEKHET